METIKKLRFFFLFRMHFQFILLCTLKNIHLLMVGFVTFDWNLYIIGLCHFILRDWIHNCLFNFQYMNQLIFVLWILNIATHAHAHPPLYINRFLSVRWVWLLNLSLSVSIDIDNIVLDTWTSRRESFWNYGKLNNVIIPNHKQ